MGSIVQTAGVTWIDGHVWRDGEPTPAAASVLHDRGFVLGDGLFETILVRDGLPVLWAEHIDRLIRTGEVLRFPMRADFSANARQAAEAVLGEADEALQRRGALRITVTRGSGTAFGLDADDTPAPTVVFRLTPAKRKSRAPADRERAWIVDQPRIDPAGLLSGHKTTSSMWRVLAHETARAEGADLAILKTLDGDIGEADSASFFAVIDDVVVTPPLDRGILPSTTRAFVLEAAPAQGHAVEERRLFAEDLQGASEAFLTSSVSGIRPLGAIDRRPFPEAAPVALSMDEHYEGLEGGF